MKSLFIVLDQLTTTTKREGPDEEWRNWKELGDPVEHIDLRNWADLCLVAPLSAHSLAKFATGLCDDTLSCVVRAWDYGQYGNASGDGEGSCSGINSISNGSTRRGKPLLVAPAMNTAMWLHPLTSTQLDTLRSFGQHYPGEATANSSSSSSVRVIPPQSKMLACGEVGDGALAPTDAIVRAVKDALRDFGIAADERA